MAQRVVVITGGGRGIGRAIGQRFGEEGTQVVAVSRSREELDQTKELVERGGGRCDVQSVDVGDPAQVDTLMKAVVNRFKRVDVLVNCAGTAHLGTIEEFDPSVFEAISRVNMEAVYLCSRAVWPVMKAQGEGVIVNISSVASVDPFPGFTLYAASKAWVNGWTRALADEGRPLGIRVFAVAPGAVETRMLRSAFPDFPKEQSLRPEDVAGVVHAVSRPACAYVTGQTIFVRK